MNRNSRKSLKFKTRTFLKNRGALSPLVATILLVVFALVIGTITMNWGRSYVEKMKEEAAGPKISSFESTVVISIGDIDTPLKKLQIRHITGEITEEEYIKEEKALING